MTRPFACYADLIIALREDLRRVRRPSAASSFRMSAVRRAQASVTLWIFCAKMPYTVS